MIQTSEFELANDSPLQVKCALASVRDMSVRDFCPITYVTALSAVKLAVDNASL
jgi:hypothetical protein